METLIPEWVLQSTELKSILGLIAADVLLAIAYALWKGEFSLSQLPRSLMTNVFPYVIVYAATRGILEQTVSEYDAEIGAVVYAFIVAKLLMSIYGHIADFGLTNVLPASVQTAINKIR